MLRNFFQTAKEVFFLPRVEIRMWGEGKQAYSYFIKPHPRYKVI